MDFLEWVTYIYTQIYFYPKWILSLALGQKENHECNILLHENRILSRYWDQEYIAWAMEGPRSAADSLAKYKNTSGGATCVWFRTGSACRPYIHKMWYTTSHFGALSNSGAQCSHIRGSVKPTPALGLYLQVILGFVTITCRCRG